MKNYQIINYCLISILALGGTLFLLIFFETIEGPECYYQEKYGVECPTCGLTHDFIDILNQKNFRNIPVSSRAYFIFFLYFFFSRFLFLFLSKRYSESKRIVVLDIILSLPVVAGLVSAIIFY